MLFSQPRVIQKINRYTIPLAIDKNRPGSRTEAELRYFAPGSGVRARLVSPDGRLLEVADISAVRALIDKLEMYAKQCNVEPVDPSTVAPRLDRPSAVPEGGVALQLTGRLLKPKEGETFSLPVNPEFRIPLNRNALPRAQALFQQRFDAPTMEWMNLTADELRSIVGSDAKPGATRTLDDATARAVVWRLRPPTHYPHPRITDLERAEVRATIVSVEGTQVKVRLEGTFKAHHRWFPLNREGVWLGNINRFSHWAEGSMDGELVYDTANGRVLAFEIATRDAAYRGKDGTDMPFGVEAHLQPFETASTATDDSVPR